MPSAHIMCRKQSLLIMLHEIKKSVKIPVGVINRINDPILADQLIVQGKVDLVWMMRPLVADPELPNKAAKEDLMKSEPASPVIHVMISSARVGFTRPDVL